MREKHTVRVGGVPVTDADNGGKANNTVELTALRWRFLPFPAWLLIPLFLIFSMFLSAGAGKLDVTNAKLYESGVYWVAGTAGTGPIDLRWDSSPLALLKLREATSNTTLKSLTMGSGHFSASGTASVVEPKNTYHFTVGPLLGGNDQTATVNYLFTRKETPLEVIGGAGAATTENGFEFTLEVPENGSAGFRLRNAAQQDLRLNYYTVKPLDPSSAFLPNIPLTDGVLQHGEMSRAEDFVFKRNGDRGHVGDEDTLVLATTDANRPIVTVKLRMVSGSGRTQPGGKR
jgi:hypothetical protein